MQTSRTRGSFIVGLILLTAVFGTRAVRADDKAPERQRTISVTGQAEVDAAPDLAQLAVAVETTAPKAADAVRDNATRSTKVAAALKGLIGEKDKITTTRYALEPRYESVKPGERSEPR